MQFRRERQANLHDVAAGTFHIHEIGIGGLYKSFQLVLSLLDLRVRVQ